MRPPLLYRVTLTGDSLNDPSEIAEEPAGDVGNAGARLTLRVRTPQPVVGGGAIGFELTRRTPPGGAAVGPGLVQVRIIDLQGREVRSERIVLGARAPTLWHWDGCDDAGRRVPSGFYGAICEGVDLPGARTVRRLVVLR
jgi:hypothetical protein